MLQRLIILLLLIMFSTAGQALTLGQIHVHSFINQPLKATIDLKGVKGDELAALKIKLASRSAFKNAGVDWSERLEDLRFSVIQNNRGYAVRVISRKAVAEPFLSFVVDARWANGKMTKDFTLLLDPPLYSGKKAAPIDVADTASVAEISPAQSAAADPQPQAVTQTPSPNKAAASSSSSKSGPAAQTMTGASLWQVASKVRPADATMQQTMVAIQEENPESFIRGNMNLLKKGELLRIPSAEVIRGISATAAVNRVAKHERARRAGKSIKPSKRLSPEIVALAAEPQKAVTPQPEDAGSGGRLRLDSAADAVNEGSLIGDQDSDTSTPSVDGVGSDENRALRSRVALLEEQLKVAHRLIRMKGELAQLQQLYRQIDAQKAQVDSDQTELTDEQLLLLAEADPDQQAASSSDDTGVADADTVAQGGGSAQQDGLETTLSAIETQARESDEPVAAEVEKTAAVTANVEDQAVADETPASIAGGAGSAETAVEDVEKEEVVTQENAEQLSATAATNEDAAIVTVAEENTASSTETTEKQQTSVALVDANSGENASLSPPALDQQAADPLSKRDSLVEGIDNNLLLGAGGVGAVGLLLSFLLGRRGRKQSAERDDGFKEEALVGESPGAKSLDDEVGEVEDAREHRRELEGKRITQPTAADETLGKQSIIDTAAQFNPPERLSIDQPEVLDPLELAKVLIRDNQTLQAREVLMQAIDAEPERTDLHIQLMELLHADKDRAAFEIHMKRMEQSGISIDSGQQLAIDRMHGNLLPAGFESTGIVKQIHTEAETINLEPGEQGSSEGEDHDESDLEAALQAFEMELDDKRSDEVLSAADLAPGEAGTVANSISNAIPDTRIVEDLELAEDLLIDENGDAEQQKGQPGVISLDDSFGVDSHISNDFEDIFTSSGDAEQYKERPEAISLDDSFGIDSHISSDFEDLITNSSVVPERQSEHPSGSAEEKPPEPDAEALSITSFDTDPSALKQAEVDAKIDLAAAFSDMGDVEGARDILDEVMSEGSPQQQRAAQEMLKKFL